MYGVGRALDALDDFNLGVKQIRLLKLEQSGQEQVRDLADTGVVSLDAVVVAGAHQGDLVLKQDQLFVKLRHHLVALQVGVLFLQAKKLLHHGHLLRDEQPGRGRVKIHRAPGGIPELGQVGLQFLLVLQIFLGDLDEVWDEIGAFLE